MAASRWQRGIRITSGGLSEQCDGEARRVVHRRCTGNAETAVANGSGQWAGSVASSSFGTLASLGEEARGFLYILCAGDGYKVH